MEGKLKIEGNLFVWCTCFKSLGSYKSQISSITNRWINYLLVILY